MLTITIFAAGLVCLAGVLGLGLWRAQAQVATATAGTSLATAEPTADERGITLQTLIVTAVLVLMAVAAGVVIVAITNNAAEDLEQTAPDLEGTCNAVELYDPILAAQNGGGIQLRGRTLAGLEGSARGCVPVCFVESSGKLTEVFVDGKTSKKVTGTVYLAADSGDGGAWDKDIAKLFDSTYHTQQASADQNGNTIATGSNFNLADGTALTEGSEVRVSAATNACVIEYANGDEGGDRYTFRRLRS